MHAKPTIILNEIHTEFFSQNIIKENLLNKIEKLEIKFNKIEACLSNFLEMACIRSNLQHLSQ